MNAYRLLFRDDLHEILSSGISLDRNLEKRFKEWLVQCHSNLDRIIRFCQLCSTKRQAEVRSTYGESITAFEKISDGHKTIESGAFLKIAGKPAVIGQVKYFTVPLVVRQEGAYANGRVHLQLLPAEVYNETNLHTFSLRRVDCILTDEQVQSYTAKELGKLPSVLRIEPIKLTTGKTMVKAGEAIPESSVSIVNGHGAKLTKAFFNGEKQSLSVVQRLWLLPPADDPLRECDSLTNEQATEGDGKENGRKGKGRSRKGRKANHDGAGEEASNPNIASKSPILVFEIENKAPRKDTYYFSHIHDATGVAGDYSLEFIVAQTPQGHDALKHEIPLIIQPSSPSDLKVSGEGAVTVAIEEVVLGEELPQFVVTLIDNYGNKVPGIAKERLTVQLETAADQDHGPGPNKAIAVNYRLEDLGDRFAVHEIQCSGSLTSQEMQQQSNSIFSVPATLKFQVNERFEESVSMTLRPGVPQKISLIDCGEWHERGLRREVPSGEELPEFEVRVSDSWGNMTAPSARLPFDIVVGSDALVPNSQTFAVNENGVATVSGFTIAHTFSGLANLLVRIACKPECEAMRKALQVAQPLQDLELNFNVSTSTWPAALRLSYNGENVDIQSSVDEESGDVAVLQGIEAGSTISGLRLYLVDASGQDAAATVNGKVIVSWRKGSKRISWDGTPIKLPTIKVPDSITEIINEFVRFQGDSSFPVVLECGLEVRPVSGAPTNWAISLADTESGRNHVEESGIIRSGHRFTLEIEALDSRMNRCAGVPGSVAEPMVLLESEGPLNYNPEEWERGWITQGGHDIYLVHMTVTGHPGALQVTVKDCNGDDGESLLNSDTITLDLLPGNPARLIFEGPTTISCSTRSLLGPLEVKLCDSSGYPTTATESIDVALVGSALACDGSGRAARVVCNGSNKVKIPKGESRAIFKQISIYAEEGGTYALRIQSASRKYSLQEGILQLDMTAEVIVTGLEVQPLLLEDGAGVESFTAGKPAKFLVNVFVEGGLSIPLDIIRSGLSLTLKPPNETDALSCILDVEESRVEDGLEERGSNRFVFVSPGELCVSGEWTAVAEYEEPRLNLKAALGKSARLRSASVPFDLVAGAPVKAVLAGSYIPDSVAVTNSSSAKARRLIRGVAVEVHDINGNVAVGDGIEVRFKICFSNSINHRDDFDVLPQLTFEVGGPVISVDDSGRAYFGNISIVEGSGKAENGTLEFDLVCEARGLYPCQEIEMDADDEGWVVCWRCSVLFSDNSSNSKQLEELNDERERIMARQSLISKEIAAAEHAHQVAVNKGNAISANMKNLQDRSLVKAFPSTLEKAREECEVLKGRLLGQQEKGMRHARWGPEKALMTGAIQKVLDLGEKGVIGVFAQLVTVQDEKLAQVASAALRGLLPVVILQETSVRDHLTKYLSSHKYPLPDTLALTHLNAYRSSTKDDLPGFANANDVARSMTKAACMGTDPPLPIPLPHHKRQNPKNKESLRSLSWPEGCIGYLVNLLRPVHSGHRASVLYGLCSGILVFESLADGSAYRENLISKLNVSCPCDIISLDGGRISSRGIVSGASFRPPPLETADFVIGASASSAGENIEEDKLGVLLEWMGLLEEKAAVEEVAKETKRSLAALEAQYEHEIGDLNAQLRDIDIKIHSISNSRRDKTRVDAEIDEHESGNKNVDFERVALTTLNVDNDLEGRQSRKSKRRRTAVS